MIKRESLNGKWQLKVLGQNVFGIPEMYIDATVPGTVYGTLLEEKLIPDPFYRDNELKVLKLMENEFEYKRSFVLTEENLGAKECILRFEGIDTLADVYVNDKLVGSTDNMHRSYEFSLLLVGVVGENELKVILHSPTKYIKQKNAEIYAGGSGDCMEGFPHLRKAHCMFGWDWGPRIPDAGIFRDVSIVTIDEARIGDVYIIQNHEPGVVTLSFETSIEEFGFVGNADEWNYTIDYMLISPNGDKVYLPENDDSIVVEQPELWYPSGYGKQPLYTISVMLKKGDEILDTWEKKIGLRTMVLNRDKTEWGENFAHEVNGMKIFAMGADYIPEDNLFGRINEARTRQLLEAAKLAGHNIVRVWGGGYYPDDYFFDICDELGLLVWQDFMFSCACYELDDEFEENITAEIRENVIRIRHHACLCLWCGNNEMETQTLSKSWKPSIKQHCDYIKIFEYIIPKILKEVDPNGFYWPSSPSSGGNYDNPWDSNRGDTHDWSVWHGERPFIDYRKHVYTYISEFGFQSFPSEKTIDTFALPEDKNIFSRVMEMHQRNTAANGKIMKYMGDTYLYPTSFSKLLYYSQLLQAEAIKTDIEHSRRNRGRCMGVIVWQLNDIWPVASWSSIDYYGRWKALHYYEKRCFEPIHISCEDIGENVMRPYPIAEPKPVSFSARFHVANETADDIVGSVNYYVKNNVGKVVRKGTFKMPVYAYSGAYTESISIEECEIFDHYVEFEWLQDGERLSYGTVIFTHPKHYHFEDPKLSVVKKGDSLIVNSTRYAKSVYIEGIDGDVVLSDNFFDMSNGTREVKILRGNATKFKIDSVYMEI